MSEIPVEIQCFSDPETICPVREAVYKVDELHERPLEERGTIDDYNARLRQIAEPLSWMDQHRFFSILGTGFGRSVLDPESCKIGPRKDYIFFGKKVCDAQTVYEEWHPAASEKIAG